MELYTKFRIALIIGASLSPILIGTEIYSVVDCTTLNNNNYKAWLDQGNKGTMNEMIKDCNSLHPLAIYTLYPAAIPLGFLYWYSTKKGMFDNEQPNRKGVNHE